MELKLERPIIFFDLETTSSNPQEARIVQYAFIKVLQQSEQQPEIMHRLINPGIPIPSEAILVHGITDEMVSGEPTFKDRAERVFNFIENSDFAGFNIINYDLPVLKNEFQRCGHYFDYSRSKVIDVMSIYHHFNPRDLTAAYLHYCQKDLEGAHGSLADTKATLEVFQKQIETHFRSGCNLDDIEAIIFDQDKYVDRERKFAWNDQEEACFTFGKFANQSLQKVRNMKPDYLEWMINGSFSDEIKQICKDALYDNQFPEKAGKIK